MSAARGKGAAFLTSWASARPASVSVQRSAAQVGLVVISVLFASCVIVIVLRRVAGALEQPLSAATLAATGLVAVLVANLVRAAWLLRQSEHGVIIWTPTALVLLLMLALWLPGTNVAGVLLLGTAVAADIGMAAAWRAGWGQSILRRRDAGVPRRIEALGSSRFPADMLQQLTRRRMPDGSERIEGQVRVLISARQKTEHCHMAFCPALDGPPTVTCSQREGPTARLKVAQVLPQGVRIEVRLEQPAAEDSSIVIGVAVGTVQVARQDARNQTG